MFIRIPHHADAGEVSAFRGQEFPERRGSSHRSK
jgi:hypothetical protein